MALVLWDYLLLQDIYGCTPPITCYCCVTAWLLLLPQRAAFGPRWTAIQFAYSTSIGLGPAPSSTSSTCCMWIKSCRRRPGMLYKTVSVATKFLVHTDYYYGSRKRLLAEITSVAVDVRRMWLLPSSISSLAESSRRLIQSVGWTPSTIDIDLRHNNNNYILFAIVQNRKQRRRKKL